MHHRHSSPRRRGLGRGDVVVLLALIGATTLLVIMGLTRAREQGRLTGCTRNLSQIGFGLVLHDRMNGHLPGTATMPPDLPPNQGPAGPLKTLLESLDLPDLTALRDAQTPPKGQPGHVSGEVPVPGFICASDPNAIAGRLPAPVSYRASTGDSHLGDNGAFAPGAPGVSPRSKPATASATRPPSASGSSAAEARALRTWPATGSSRLPCPAADVRRHRARAVCGRMQARPGSRAITARRSTTMPYRPTAGPPASPTTGAPLTWARRAATSGVSTSSAWTDRSA